MTDTAEKDAAVEALRQKILALPPTDFCGHFASDFNGNCMTCAREAERREDMARAWDEGKHSEHVSACRLGDGDCICPNPYRLLPPVCQYRSHSRPEGNEPCDCEARLAAVVAHHVVDDPAIGPPFCQECSEAISEYVPWDTSHQARVLPPGEGRA